MQSETDAAAAPSHSPESAPSSPTLDDDSIAACPPDLLRLYYQTTSQHWSHAEQVRWTLLYNFLMAATIIVLGWGALLSSSIDATLKEVVLGSLSSAGLVVSLAWLRLADRANGFVYHYAGLGRRLESAMRVLGPFHSAEAHRSKISATGGGRIETRIVLRLVPIVFALLSAVLLSLSLVL